MDCSLSGSSNHGILQARILEWVAMPSSRLSSRPRDRTCVSCSSCTAGRFFTAKPLGKPSDAPFSSVQLLSHIWLFETLWTAALQASLSITNSQSLLKLIHVHWVGDAIQPSHPVLLQPSIFPSIRICSNESVLCIRWTIDRYNYPCMVGAPRKCHRKWHKCFNCTEKQTLVLCELVLMTNGKCLPFLSPHFI